MIIVIVLIIIAYTHFIMWCMEISLILICNYININTIYLHDKTFCGLSPFCTSGHWGIDCILSVRAIIYTFIDMFPLMSPFRLSSS